MHGHHKSAIPAHQAPISHALNASYSVKPLVSPIPLPHHRFPSSFLTPSPPFPFSQLFDISDPEKSFMQMTGHYTDIDIPRCCCRATSRFLARNLLYLSFLLRDPRFSLFPFPLGFLFSSQHSEQLVLPHLLLVERSICSLKDT